MTGGSDRPDKVRIGWVGTGFVGQVAHLVNYTDLPNAQVVALAERRPELGRRVCARYGIPRFYPDHTALLEDPEIDAVVAVVRREHTATVALDVLRGGRHLFTEKPMAATYEQAEKLVSAAKGLRYAIGFMRRHDEGSQIAKRLLTQLMESQELGAVVYARFYCFAGYDWCNIGGAVATDEPRPAELFLPLGPDWLDQQLHVQFDRFNNVYSHDLNFIRYMFDRRPSVAHVHYRPDRMSVATLDFGDFPGVFEFGEMNQRRWEEGVDVYFERGRLRLELPPAMLRNMPARVELYKDKGAGERETVCPQADWTWAFRRQAEAFVDDVRLGREPLASGAESLDDMRLLEDVWRHISGVAA